MPAKRKAAKAASTSPTNVSTEGENASAYTDVMLTNNISRSSSVAPSTEKPEEVQAPDVASQDDLEEQMAPDSAVKEEHRLRAEREAAEAKEAHETEAVLEETKFNRLERLIFRATQYSAFLGEQMQYVEEQTLNEISTDGNATKKRKTGKQKAAQVASEESQRATVQALCPGFVGALRDYQLKGVRWLISLYQNGLSGILADEMGLGKTVQTIAFLAHLKSKAVHGPYMVVGPLSTLPNWVNEFKRWTPEMAVCLYHGSKEDRARLRQTELRFTPGAGVGAKFPIVCTSYEIVMADRKFFERFPQFKYIVVDEGHRLKNTNCKLIRELRCVPAANKLLLTGTPLQNNLSELWSLLNFMLPEVFQDAAEFEAWFDFEGMVGQEGGKEKLAAMEQRDQVVSKLHRLLKPFVLRRLKSEVVQSMPGKTEIILYAAMSALQKQLNNQIRDKTLAELNGSKGASVGSLNNVMMQMRKNCNHPDLIVGGTDGDYMYPNPETLIEQCGKFQLLDRLLTRLKAGGHKVLIFSQMTKLLDLLESFLSQRGESVCRLDGSTSWQERQANIDAFSTDPKRWVFLLSTRAGGLGINLTAADTVILYDSDWNPQQDLQAMDRCHRLGQQRPVLVFRMATAHSFEGRMLKRAADKMALERLVMKKGEFADVQDTPAQDKKKLGADELLELLREDVSLADEAQSGVVDDDLLAKLLDRAHMEGADSAPYPTVGVGYEVVKQQKGGLQLTGIQ